ncbi:MAG: type II toxin-antitoxin system VapC family toxin [Gaiellales bacterium]
MVLVVLDASIVIGHLSALDRHHEAASSALSHRGDADLRLPASAYAESLVGPGRSGLSAHARQLIRSLAISIDPIDGATAEEAARMRARHRSLRLPDALVLAHAEVLEADEVLTTDATWKRFSRRVRIVA